MEGSAKFWKVKDKSRRLLMLMEELAGNARVSFEGELQGYTLSRIPGASAEPTAVLKRNTIWPKQDFVIVPLELSSGERIIAAIGGSVSRGIIHVQIEKDGLLQFGAYDNFDPECIYFGTAVKQTVIDSLISQDILRPYSKQRPKGGRGSQTSN